MKGISVREIGREHPDGRTVLMVGGAEYTQGGYSNWWQWREIFDDGSLGPVESGYGWGEITPEQRELSKSLRDLTAKMRAVVESIAGRTGIHEEK